MLPQAPAAARPLPVEEPSPPLIVETVNDIVMGRSVDTPLRVAQELRRGPPVPTRELDLHRMSAAQARSALATTVRQARADGMRSLVVICGQGKHSGRAGAVLPAVVVEQLSEALAAHVLAFRTAPPRFGGAGAVIVRLRARAERS